MCRAEWHRAVNHTCMQLKWKSHEHSSQVTSTFSVAESSWQMEQPGGARDRLRKLRRRNCTGCPSSVPTWTAASRVVETMNGMVFRSSASMLTGRAAVLRGWDGNGPLMMLGISDSPLRESDGDEMAGVWSVLPPIRDTGDIWMASYQSRAMW